LRWTVSLPPRLPESTDCGMNEVNWPILTDTDLNVSHVIPAPCSRTKDFKGPASTNTGSRTYSVRYNKHTHQWANGLHICCCLWMQFEAVSQTSTHLHQLNRSKCVCVCVCVCVLACHACCTAVLCWPGSSLTVICRCHIVSQVNSCSSHECSKVDLCLLAVDNCTVGDYNVVCKQHFLRCNRQCQHQFCCISYRTLAAGCCISRGRRHEASIECNLYFHCCLFSVQCFLLFPPLRATHNCDGP